MGTQLPELDFKTIYRQTPGGLTVGERIRTALMNFMMPASQLVVKQVSSDGKLDTFGRPYNHYMGKLPEMDVTFAVVGIYQSQHAKGTAAAQGFPYKLKATGLVDANEIMRYQNTHNHFISDDVRVVP